MADEPYAAVFITRVGSLEFKLTANKPHKTFSKAIIARALQHYYHKFGIEKECTGCLLDGVEVSDTHVPIDSLASAATEHTVQLILEPDAGEATSTTSSKAAKSALPAEVAASTEAALAAEDAASQTRPAPQAAAAKRQAEAEARAAAAEQAELRARKIRSLVVLATEITAEILIGDQASSMYYKKNVEMGITHVLDLKGGGRAPPPPFDTKLTVREVKLSDHGRDELCAKLPECMEFLDAAHAAGGRCLVHCSDGNNRSATVVLYYLISSARTRWSLRSAWECLHARRAEAVPHPKYWAQLQAAECAEHGLTEPSISAEEAGISIPTSAAAAAGGRGNIANSAADAAATPHEKEDAIEVAHEVAPGGIVFC